MSKRVRGSERAHRRPGARPASERAAGARVRPVRQRPSQLEVATEAAEDIVEGRPAEAATELVHSARAVHPRHRTKPGSLLAARAATEYVYVSQDIRRILIVSTVLFGVLIALWPALVVLRVVALPFY